jgi:hypothetical protein
MLAAGVVAAVVLIPEWRARHAFGDTQNQSALYMAYHNPANAEVILRGWPKNRLSDATIAGALGRLHAATKNFADLLRTAAPGGEGVINQPI